MEENRYYKVQDRKLYEEYENYLSASLNNLQIIHGCFELIEDQTIDNIEELEKFIYVGNSISEIKEGFNRLIDKQNEVIRGMKHLNKEIQSIKEK